jgi:serine/threonine protein kinase
VRSFERGYGFLAFGSILGGTKGKSRVYAISGHGDRWAIKYQVDCGDTYYQRFDPVENEGKFLQMLNGSGITNELLYYSSGVEFDNTIPVSSPFGKIGHVERVCTSRFNTRSTPLLRYLVTEKVGMSLHTSGQIPVGRAIELSIQMLDLIEQLHNLNIIHGDVHPGNFAFSLTDPTKLLMIDFGRAEVMGGGRLPHPPTFEGAIYCEAYASAWESRRLPQSFRDDLYRMFISIGRMIYGPKYTEALQSICFKNKYRDEYVRVKETDNILDIEFKVSMHREGRSGRGVVEFFLSSVLPEGIRMQVSGLLLEALDLVRALAEGERPDYGELRGKLSQVRNLL